MKTEQVKFFATFGTSQLKDFEECPSTTLVTLKGADETELREALLSSPVGSNFCTIYPYSSIERFSGCKLIELSELMKGWKKRPMSLKQMRGY